MAHRDRTPCTSRPAQVLHVGDHPRPPLIPVRLVGTVDSSPPGHRSDPSAQLSGTAGRAPPGPAPAASLRGCFPGARSRGCEFRLPALWGRREIRPRGSTARDRNVNGLFHRPAHAADHGVARR
jgi:hypothetical protein